MDLRDKTCNLQFSLWLLFHDKRTGVIGIMATHTKAVTRMNKESLGYHGNGCAYSAVLRMFLPKSVSKSVSSYGLYTSSNPSGPYEGGGAAGGLELVSSSSSTERVNAKEKQSHARHVSQEK